MLSLPGATEVNPEVEVKPPSSISGSNPAQLKKRLSSDRRRADVLFAERFGVIEASRRKGVVCLRNMSDQKEWPPSMSSIGPGLNMTQRLVRYQIRSRRHLYRSRPQDFNMVAKAGQSGPRHEESRAASLLNGWRVQAKERYFSACSFDMTKRSPRRRRKQPRKTGGGRDAMAEEKSPLPLHPFSFKKGSQ